MEQNRQTGYSQLWAPWRIGWIKESVKGVEGCFLCEVQEEDPASDRENLLLHRGRRAVIVLNRYPYSNGHLMVAPTRHLGDPRELEPDEWGEIGLLTQLAIGSLDGAMRPDGYNIGWNIGRVAGAGLETHLHQHVVPRWNGDTNFMPVTAGTKVISQDPRESYDELKEALEAFRREE